MLMACTSVRFVMGDADWSEISDGSSGSSSIGILSDSVGS